jgi:hypothetical protein
MAGQMPKSTFVHGECTTIIIIGTRLVASNYWCMYMVKQLAGIKQAIMNSSARKEEEKTTLPLAC